MTTTLWLLVAVLLFVGLGVAVLGIQLLTASYYAFGIVTCVQGVVYQLLAWRIAVHYDLPM